MWSGGNVLYINMQLLPTRNPYPSAYIWNRDLIVILKHHSTTSTPISFNTIISLHRYSTLRNTLSRSDKTQNNHITTDLTTDITTDTNKRHGVHHGIKRRATVLGRFLLSGGRRVINRHISRGGATNRLGIQSLAPDGRPVYSGHGHSAPRHSPRQCFYTGISRSLTSCGRHP